MCFEIIHVKTESEYENFAESDMTEEYFELDDSIDESDVYEEKNWHEEPIDDELADEEADLVEEWSDE
ncbi:MAG TPA: hypothetical protein VEY68_01470 [Anoxybacillus sp.]|jgi:hypothetical protein|nr:hypothetical protein [Anoxybacillus sp.]